MNKKTRLNTEAGFLFSFLCNKKPELQSIAVSVFQIKNTNIKRIMKSKNLFLAGAFVIAAFSTAQAQDLNWGIKAGVNYSTISSEIEPDHIFGYHAGIVAEFPLSPVFAIQPELLYSLEGARSDVEFSEGEFTFSSDQKIKLGYINLPVMAKYFVAPGFSLQAGPQLGYLVSGKNEYEISSNFIEDFDMNESGTADIKDEVKKISLGVNFGLGYEFQNLFLQGRYHLGLTDINNSEGMDDEFEMEMEKLKNRGFQVSIGYKF